MTDETIYILAIYEPDEGCLPLAAYPDRDTAMRRAGADVIRLHDDMLADEWHPLHDEDYRDALQADALHGPSRYILFSVKIWRGEN